MKIKIDYVFPEQYRIIAEEYISYSKRKIASTLTFLGGCFAATNI